LAEKGSAEAWTFDPESDLLHCIDSGGSAAPGEKQFSRPPQRPGSRNWRQASRSDTVQTMLASKDSAH